LRPVVCLPHLLLALAVAMACTPAQAPAGPSIDPAAARVLRRGIQAMRALVAVQIEVTRWIGAEDPAARDASARRLPLPSGIGLAHRVLLDWRGSKLRLRVGQQDGNQVLRTLVDDGKATALLDHAAGGTPPTRLDPAARSCRAR
jgi:hypothetical protein